LRREIYVLRRYICYVHIFFNFVKCSAFGKFGMFDLVLMKNRDRSQYFWYEICIPNPLVYLFLGKCKIHPRQATKAQRQGRNIVLVYL